MKKRECLTVFFGCLCLLSGCGQKDMYKLGNINIPSYQAISYETQTVEKGDLVPSVLLQASADTKDIITYNCNADELELDKVMVSEGQEIKKGQTLITFKAEDIKKKIDELRQQCEENKMLADHYEQLMKIDNTQKYDKEIKMLRDDIVVQNLEIQEQQAMLDSMNIIAKEDGIVTSIEDAIYSGKITLGMTLMKQSTGSEYYIARTKENYPFEEGKTYEGISGEDSCNLKLEKIEQDDEKILYFLPLSGGGDEEGGKHMYTIELEKEPLKGVVYVPKEAVKESKAGKFVYEVDENGFRNPVYVETGETIDNQTIITKGLAGGEQVTIN